ncbi:MAG: hypothetical protein KDC98_07620 [Planctomycetes bacterium]|nr:hypothetical protein [Planctomycetota bacterium]
MPKLRLLFAALLIVPACSVHSYSSHVTFSDPQLGQVRLETLDRDRIAIATYKDGQLFGAEVASELEGGFLGDWARDRMPVDHPSLRQWRSQLTAMQQAATAPGEDPGPVLAAAAGFPFAKARMDCLQQWAGEGAARCAALLDRHAELDIGRADAVRLTRLALPAASSEERLARWLDAMAEENHHEAALLIARSPGVGVRCAEVVLRRLDDFSLASRRPLFDALAFLLLGDPGRSGLLFEAVDELPSQEEGAAMLGLLRTPHASAELGLRVLRGLDEFRSGDRASLLHACGRIVIGNRRGADALATALDELRSTERLAMAKQLLALPADTRLCAALLRVADDLPSRDRQELVLAVLEQPHWDPVIEAAARQAATTVPSRQRESLLQAIGRRQQRARR